MPFENQKIEVTPTLDCDDCIIIPDLHTPLSLVVKRAVEELRKVKRVPIRPGSHYYEPVCMLAYKTSVGWRLVVSRISKVCERSAIPAEEVGRAIAEIKLVS